MIWLFYAVLIVILAFGSVILFGAPFLPTLKVQITAALDLLDLKPGQTMLELGSGDGRVLRAAARRNIKGIGYEINPILYMYSKVACRKYHQLVTIHFGNYWSKRLPKADGIYVFLLDRYMSRLDTKITQEITQPMRVISFAFAFKGRTPSAEQKGLMLYEFRPKLK